MRVVLDTNTVVSALVFARGRLTWVRELWVAGAFTPLCSRDTLSELTRVLAYPKFQLDEADIRDLLNDYLFFVDIIDMRASPVGELPHCRDSEDQAFLELASSGKADVLVTGDSDILALVGQVPFTVERPADFRRRFRHRTGRRPSP